MEQKSNAFLEQEKIGVLMRKFTVPCIISLLVGALYNIVDQIFSQTHLIWVPTGTLPIMWCSHLRWWRWR